MAITDETRKRLWGRSGNQCALCQCDLIRDDLDGQPGALIGVEAHIIGRSPGGPRFQPLEVTVRDGYDNLILLCANDHIEVDRQAGEYPVGRLRRLKRDHEHMVANKRREGAKNTQSDPRGETVATLLKTGDEAWNLMRAGQAYDCEGPDDLTDEEAAVVDDVLQSMVDWGEVADEVAAQGFRQVREGKQSLQTALEELARAGFVALGGRTSARFGLTDSVRLEVSVVRVVRPRDLEGMRLTATRRPHPAGN